jgi:DNA-binding transcriptional LysR family regulator
MQHYSFAVDAFIKMVEQFGMDEYEFAVHETRTRDVIDDVKNLRSEIGVLYINDFNRKVMEKLFRDNELEFHNILDCGIFVFIWDGHPLADRQAISIEELQEYPCLAFDQGINNSFYFAEEVLSTYEYRQTIKVNDRATMLNLMKGLNGYTLCCGIICERQNGSDYRAVPLISDEVMTIGYISRKGVAVSSIGQRYIEHLKSAAAES